jgi:hypothetical protein
MNKVYSKVWNKSLMQLVVASEFASRSGKSGGTVDARSGSDFAAVARRASAAALMVALIGIAGPAHAQYSAGGATAGTATSIDIGSTCANGTFAPVSSAAGSIAIGACSATAATATTASGTNAVAFGTGAQATGNSTLAIGQAAQAGGTGAVALGNNAQAYNQGSTAVGSGAVAGV